MKNKSVEYKHGFDAGKNGSNKTNCHFSNFPTAERKKEWEKGYKNGLRAKRRAENKPFMIGGVEYAVLEINYKPPLNN
jgi:ribosome modulation factor